jgi:HAD superfamily hydrolase (TIGR01549 family)
MLTALLFDLDGTLTDTNRLHAEALARSFEAHGYNVPVARILPEIGKGAAMLIRDVLGPDVSQEDAKAMAERHTEIYLERLQAEGTTLLPGALDLIEAARARELKVGLATSSETEELEATARAAGLDLALFDAYTTASDVADAKPEPDPILAIARKLGVATAETALVGDTPHDGRSALRAGSVLLAVENPAHTSEALRRAGARGVYADAAALAAALDEALDAASPSPHRLTQNVMEALMEAALLEAEWALQEGNLPVGAVLARSDGSIISRAGNAARQRGLDIAHAEIEALQLAAPLPSNAREFVLATTLEPCRMCLGAALEQGLDAVIYALEAPENGGTQNVTPPAHGTHVFPRLARGVLRDRSRALFEEFVATPPRRASQAKRDFARRLLRDTETHD